MAVAQPAGSVAGNRFVFSSDGLPGHTSLPARIEATLEALFGMFRGASRIVPSKDVPFCVRLEGIAFRDVALVCPTASSMRWLRTASDIAGDDVEMFQIGFNAAGPPLRIRQHGRECILRSGDASIISMAEPVEVQSRSGMNTLSLVCIPGSRLRERIINPDDHVGMLAPRSPTLRHLGNYVQCLRDTGDADRDAELAAHVETELIDLAALVFGTHGGDSASFACTRGLRQARARRILAEINANYASPGFSVGVLSARIGLSRRYVQELLHESGHGFCERVQELRLQKARAMLDDGRFDGVKIIDIALACGFDDVCYFNRCFRRRFGLTPSRTRNGSRCTT